MKRKKMVVALTALLSLSTIVQSVGATWNQVGSDWYLQNDDGTNVQNQWYQDTDGNWYYLGNDGKMNTGWISETSGNKFYLDPESGGPLGSMSSGWKLINGQWYFFNTVHDGSYGKVLTGWQWIDGYCYYFDEAGVMAANTITPDGFYVNESGAWVQDGTVIYQEGKGIQTKISETVPSSNTKSSGSGGNSGGSSGGGGGSSSGGSGGSGGSGSSGGSSGSGSSSGSGGSGSGSGSSSGSSGGETKPSQSQEQEQEPEEKETYSYTVNCMDDDTDSLIQSFTGTGEAGSSVSISQEIEGYELVPGQNTAVVLSADNLEFTLYYKEDTEIAETCTYTILYKDHETNRVLQSETGIGQIGTVVEIEYPDIEGYRLCNEQVTTFRLDAEEKTIEIYYEKEPEETKVSYTVNYLESGTNLRLGYFTGIAVLDSTVTVPCPEFYSHKLKEDQENSYVVDKDKTILNIYYEKETVAETSSDADVSTYYYVVECYDEDTEEKIGEFSNFGLKDSTVDLAYEIGGYFAVGETKMVLSEDSMYFTVSYRKDSGEEILSYEIQCIDQNKEVLLESHKGTGVAGEVITPDYPISGYFMVGTPSFELEYDKEVFFVYYEEDESSTLYPYLILQYDINSMDLLGQISLTGHANEILWLDDLSIEGYNLLGQVPKNVTVSSIAENNVLTLYYEEINTYVPEAPTVTFEIEYVDADNHSVHVRESEFGTGKVGSKLPVYFPEEVNSNNARWKSLGYSPRIIELTDLDYNIFTIEYLKQEDIEKEELELMHYSIRYLAEDTKATLGVTTGYAYPGTSIPFRNNFITTEYGISDPSVLKLIVSKDPKENDIVVPYKRVMFPGPEKNENTNRYDGNMWLVVFVDEYGHHLMPELRGFSLPKMNLIVDYPDTIEKDGYVYRAVKSSPYIEIQDGTTYHQIEIEYRKGEASQSKLDLWKQKAQEAKDAFYGTTPYSYSVAYKERNSWNDIGYYLGVEHENTKLEMPVPVIPDYIVPEEDLEGFTLTEDGLQKTTYYTRFNTGTSVSYRKTPFTIQFQDEDGNDLFDSYSGNVASPSAESVVDYVVWFPEEFTDKEGNVWTANVSSPQTFKIDTLSLNNNVNTVTYRKTFDNPKQNFVVRSEDEALRVFKDLALRINDSKEKKFYLIGEDYSPHDMIPGPIIAQYNLINYGNTIVDRFVLDGKTYTVCEIYISRVWDEKNCVHDWEITRKAVGGCMVSGNETVTCTKCGKEVKTILPALGHIDENYDSVCDVCGARSFKQEVGDEITITFDSRDLGLGTHTFYFVCIDDDYQGTGKMLYMCKSSITSELYQTYSYNNQVEFENSELRDFLNDAFADGLGSMIEALRTVKGDRVSILTKEEVDYYKKNAINKYLFPSGTFLTSTLNETGDKIVLSNGKEVTPEEASSYAAKPVILLDAPYVEDENSGSVWSLGDVQAREINGEVYLFRCVNERYKDKTNTSEELALFLCDSVIPADVVDDPKTENIETIFFGDNNNYKYSDTRDWLEQNAIDKLFGFHTTSIGVDTAYTGSTKPYTYSGLDDKLLKKYNIGTQYLEGQIFILSLEEALSLRNYLWKFEGSTSENPDTQIRQYCDSYWLRTPEYGSDDNIYSVNLVNGTIEAIPSHATEGNDYCDTGIRPAFALVQNR